MTGCTPKHAMVLAAGRGERMRPLTDTLPKPLIDVGGRALVDRVIDRLEDAGVGAVAVNLHHLGHLIEDHLGRRASGGATWDRDRLGGAGGSRNSATNPPPTATGAGQCFIQGAIVCS